MRKKFVIIALVTLFTTGLSAQILKPIKWEISSKKVSEGVYDIICKATIEENWHLYDAKLPAGGPIPTTFNLDEDEASGIELVGKFKATTTATNEYSEAFEIELKYFKSEVTFVQQVKVTEPKGNLVGYVEFMACTGGQCTPPTEEDFEFELSK